MNITILAISTLIVLIVFGIPVATHRKSQDGSITREVIDTTNITNDIHKWLADRGYSKVG